MPAPFVDMTVPYAAGAIYSTTHDLRTWIESLLEGKLLSRKSLTKMAKPEKQGYALGIIVRTINGRRRFEHSGALRGFNCQLLHYPTDKVTIIVLNNVRGPVKAPWLADQLALQIFNDPRAAHQRLAK